jgi:hypothetical protein
MNYKVKAFFSGLILGGIGTSLLTCATAMIWSSNMKPSIPDPYLPGANEFQLITVPPPADLLEYYEQPN